MPLKKRKVATHANAPLVHSIPAYSTFSVSLRPGRHSGHRQDLEHRRDSADRQAAGRGLDPDRGAAVGEVRPPPWRELLARLPLPLSGTIGAGRCFLPGADRGPVAGPEIPAVAAGVPGPGGPAWAR